MLVAALSALVLQVAPATYDAKFSCDCRPFSGQTSGILTTTAKSDGDFNVDYTPSGINHLTFALRAGRRIIADSPGLQPSSKWQSSVDVLIEDQTFVVLVSASVVSINDGIATVEAQGRLDNANIRLQQGTVPFSTEFDIVEHIKLGQSAGDAPALTSLVETINDHFPRLVSGQVLDATVKCELTAK
jgi:hypothetical protein